MKCPKCKDRSEVLETRPTRVSTRRRRRCLNPSCLFRFTTTEAQGGAPAGSTEDIAWRAKQLAKEFRSKAIDSEALAAALAVDMRRAEIARAAKARRRQENETWYDPDATPDRLTHDELRRELGDY